MPDHARQAGSGPGHVPDLLPASGEGGPQEGVPAGGEKEEEEQH